MGEFQAKAAGEKAEQGRRRPSLRGARDRIGGRSTVRTSHLWREGRGEHATPRRMCRGVECPPATPGNPTSAFSPRAAGLVSQALEGADGEVIGSPVVSDSGRANPLLRLFEERKARRTFAREHIRSDIIAV